ncbi:MAG: hypothetical protein RBU30_24640, partial [Polyangia bacterium]|nr:hypothetical protein [Polyangia bacterium]
DENKWSQMTTAINTFVGSSDAAGMGVGIQFFPVEPPQGTVIPSSCSTDADCGLYGPCIPMFGCGGSMATDTSCDPADYAVPAVPIAELPGVSAAITSAISNTSAGGSATPTQPSFEGAATYVSAWAADNPTHLVYLLYATDGMPTGCTYNSVSAAATRAAELAAGSPPVPTYVFGVECSSENIDLDNLNDIASAGGTGSAILVDSSGTVTQTFIDTLNAIRSNAQCKYRIPEPENQQADPNLVNVSLSDPDVPGSNEQLYNTISLEGCDSSGGWYYDDVNNPTMILLCPATCDRVAQEQLDVNILVGCTTIVK